MDENAAPGSNTPQRFRASKAMSSDKMATTRGDCMWKPHPKASPPDRNTSRTTASPRNERMAPAANTKPCPKTWRRLFPPFFRKSRTLSDNTGSTHGIRFKAKPPRKAKKRATRRPLEALPFSVFALAGGETVSAAVAGTSGTEIRIPFELGISQPSGCRSTPRSESGFKWTKASRRILRRNSPATSAQGCGAALSTTPWSSGTNRMGT